MSFRPGQSGNPAGRPKGSVNTQLKMLREAAEQVLPLVVERALNGDTEAQKLIIERGMPRMKSVAPTEPVCLPEGSAGQQVEFLLQQVASGELSTTAASQTMALIADREKIRVAAEEDDRQRRVREMMGQPPTSSAYLAAVHRRLN